MQKEIADMREKLPMQTFAHILAKGTSTLTMHTAMDLIDASVQSIEDAVPAEYWT